MYVTCKYMLKVRPLQLCVAQRTLVLFAYHVVASQPAGLIVFSCTMYQMIQVWWMLSNMFTYVTTISGKNILAIATHHLLIAIGRLLLWYTHHICLYRTT